MNDIETQSCKWIDYEINEGTLKLMTGFSDESMQIIKYTDRLLTLVITRAKLKNDQSIENYVNEQIAQMRMGMKGFQVTARHFIEISSAYQGEHVECHLFQHNQPIYNHLFAVTKGLELLAITFSQPKLFTEDDLNFINTIVESFIPRK